MFGEMTGVVGGWLHLQSVSTIKRDTSPFNFQSNVIFLKFLQQPMAISNFISDVFREITRCEGGGGYLLSDKELLITSPMSPFEVYTIILSM